MEPRPRAYHVIPNAAASKSDCRGSSLIQIFRSGGNFGANAGIRTAIAWESEGMVRRYAHLATAHLARHAEVISAMLDGTNSAQPEKDEGPSSR